MIFLGSPYLCFGASWKCEFAFGDESFAWGGKNLALITLQIVIAEGGGERGRGGDACRSLGKNLHPENLYPVKAQCKSNWATYHGFISSQVIGLTMDTYIYNNRCLGFDTILLCDVRSMMSSWVSDRILLGDVFLSRLPRDVLFRVHECRSCNTFSNFPICTSSLSFYIGLF